MLFKIAFLTWAAAVSSDSVTSYQSFSNPAYVNYIHESNPILAPLRNHPAALVGEMAAIDAGAAALVFTQRKEHPKAMAVALFIMAGSRFFIAARNVQNMRGVDAQLAPHLVATNGISFYSRTW